LASHQVYFDLYSFSGLAHDSQKDEDLYRPYLDRQKQHLYQKAWNDTFCQRLSDATHYFSGNRVWLDYVTLTKI